MYSQSHVAGCIYMCLETKMHVYDWQNSLILISFYCSIGWLTGSMFSKISEPHIYRSTSTIAHLASHATDRPSLAPVLEWDVTYNILYSIHSFLCGISNMCILVYREIKNYKLTQWLQNNIQAKFVIRLRGHICVRVCVHLLILHIQWENQRTLLLEVSTISGYPGHLVVVLFLNFSFLI